MSVLCYPVLDRALGEDATCLREKLLAAAHANTSVALAGAEDKLQAALAQAWEIDAEVEDATAEYARSFLNALPLAFQRSVDIQIEPAGEVVFEWEDSPRWILTLSVNERGRIAYSGIFGSNRTRGMEVFEGAVPDAVALAIHRVSRHQKGPPARSWKD